MSGYLLFFSKRHESNERVLLAVRSDHTCIDNSVPPDHENKYVSVTAKQGRFPVTVTSSYLHPEAGFNKQLPTGIVMSAPEPMFFVEI